MKKLLVSLFVLSAVLLFGIYTIGQKTENEIHKVFAQNDQQGQVSKLLSYDKHFLKATAVSQVALVTDGKVPIVFTVTSTILHYPYKAVINNKVQLLDPELRVKVEDYFGTENWLISTAEINLLGKLKGRVQILPGRFSNVVEQFETKMLNVDYQVNLQDYSGSISFDLAGLEVQAKETEINLTSIRLKSNFSTLPIAREYEYFLEVAKIITQKNNIKSQFEGVELQGGSRIGQQENTVDLSNEWKVASSLINDGNEKLFKDSHFKLDLKGLYSPALTLLSIASAEPNQVAQALNTLIDHGIQLSLTNLSSQTPWGKIEGGMKLVLQQGAPLVEIVNNPFMLLDYISGNASVFLPDALLQLPALNEFLQIGLQSGLLKRENQILSLETQLEQGELVVNGQVIPL